MRFSWLLSVEGVNSLQRPYISRVLGKKSSLTDKTRMPSPQTPLPERARGFEKLQLFLAPLLLLWEKGLGDEGKRFVSQSGKKSHTPQGSG
jgi:hypothetical protein